MKLRTDFLEALNLSLSSSQLEALRSYAALVWLKKDDLNLTSVESEQEIWDRHITDGLFAASLIKALSVGKKTYSLADYGAGCGYIGLSAKIALGDACDLTLVETLGKRCLFMEWCIMKLGLKGARTLNVRAGASGGKAGPFDFTLERAMGKINDVLPLCCADLKSGGFFTAFQTEDREWSEEVLKLCSCSYERNLSREYKLFGEDKTRRLSVFKKI